MSHDQRSWHQIDDALERAGGIVDGEPRNEREEWLAKQICDPPPRQPYVAGRKRKRRRQTACRAHGHDWTIPVNVRIRKDGRRFCAACRRERKRAA